MEWFIAAVVMVTLGIVAVAASGRSGMSREVDRDVYRQDAWPNDHAVTSEQVSTVRFGITVRGYAMDQVDDVLDRLSRELAERDEVIERQRALLQSTGADRAGDDQLAGQGTNQVAGQQVDESADQSR